MKEFPTEYLKELLSNIYAHLHPCRTVREISEGIPEETPRGIPKGTSRGIPKGTPGKRLEGVPEKSSRQIAGSTGIKLVIKQSYI